VPAAGSSAERWCSPRIAAIVVPVLRDVEAPVVVGIGGVAVLVGTIVAGPAPARMAVFVLGAVAGPARDHREPRPPERHAIVRRTPHGRGPDDRSRRGDGVHGDRVVAATGSTRRSRFDAIGPGGAVRGVHGRGNRSGVGAAARKLPEVEACGAGVGGRQDRSRLVRHRRSGACGCGSARRSRGLSGSLAGLRSDAIATSGRLAEERVGRSASGLP
jgi:hypothetical protein